MKRILFILTIVLSISLFFSACNNDKASTLGKDEVYSCPMHQPVSYTHLTLQTT